MSYSIKKRRHERPCELCARNGTLAQRIHPINFRPEYRRLCTTHRAILGYTPVDYGHTTGRMTDR